MTEPEKPILVVEDEPDLRLFVSQALAQEGFKVIEAESGSEALIILQANPKFISYSRILQCPAG